MNWNLQDVSTQRFLTSALLWGQSQHELEGRGIVWVNYPSCDVFYQAEFCPNIPGKDTYIEVDKLLEYYREICLVGSYNPLSEIVLGVFVNFNHPRNFNPAILRPNQIELDWLDCDAYSYLKNFIVAECRKADREWNLREDSKSLTLPEAVSSYVSIEVCPSIPLRQCIAALSALAFRGYVNYKKSPCFIDCHWFNYLSFHEEVNTSCFNKERYSEANIDDDLRLHNMLSSYNPDTELVLMIDRSHWQDRRFIYLPRTVFIINSEEFTYHSVRENCALWVECESGRQTGDEMAECIFGDLLEKAFHFDSPAVQELLSLDNSFCEGVKRKEIFSPYCPTDLDEDEEE